MQVLDPVLCKQCCIVKRESLSYLKNHIVESVQHWNDIHTGVRVLHLSEIEHNGKLLSFGNERLQSRMQTTGLVPS